MTSQNLATLRNLIGGDDFNEDRTSPEFQKKLLDSIAPDVEVHEAPSLPHGGVHQGREAFFGARKTMIDLWDTTLDVQHIWEVPGDDVIVVNYVMEWKAKSTGRSVSQPGVEVITFRDGVIAKIEFFHLDTKRVLDTLDAS